VAAAYHLSEIPTGTALHTNDLNLMAMNFTHQRQRDIPIGDEFSTTAIHGTTANEFY
jgi:hypothetical protein